MTKKAEGFNTARIASGAIAPSDIVTLVEFWQARHNLTVDGFAGDKTVRSIRIENGSIQQRFHPLHPLPDGRKPRITSGFHTRNPDRPTHNGVDYFFPVTGADDPLFKGMKIGDGGRTPKWGIPFGWQAAAAAAGVVQLADASPTGFRVWIDHGDGLRTGYFHLQSLNIWVKPGVRVEAGDKLGPIGDNPKDTDARHLHFEVSPTTVYKPQDPEIWLADAEYLEPDVP